MPRENDWDMIRSDRATLFTGAGMGALRIALLFGSAAIALALIVAPIAENYARPQLEGASLDGLDLASTGSTGPRGAYTVRRSVLQASPNSVCIIRNNGLRSGEC